MKRVSSGPKLSEMVATCPSGANKTMGNSAQHFKGPALAGGQGTKHNQRGNGVKVSAITMDMPLETSLPLSPAPSSELVYAMASEGLATIECLPSMEMKDAPSLDLAVCLASPMLPDEGPGNELRQRAAEAQRMAEAQLRMRYAQEVTTRAAVRLRRFSSRKRSLDDLDLHDFLQQAEKDEAAKRVSDASVDQPNKPDDEPSSPPVKKNSPEKQTGNVVPFKHRAAVVKT